MRVTPSSTSSKIIAIIVQNPRFRHAPKPKHLRRLAIRPASRIPPTPQRHPISHHRLRTQLHRRHQMGISMLLATRNLPTNHHLDTATQRLRPTRLLQQRNNARPSKHPRRHRQKTPTHQSTQPLRHHPSNPNQLHPSLNQPSHRKPRLPLRLKQSVPEQLQSCNNCGILFLHRVVNATPAIDKDRTQYRIKA